MNEIDQPFFSIVIATKNEEKNLERLLSSIKKIPEPLEVIIVDNFSHDATLSIAKKFKTTIFQFGPERSSQRNFGAQKASGDYLLFLDADMEISPEIITQCQKLIDESKTKAIIIPETTPQYSLFSRIKKLEKSLYNGNELIEAPRVISKAVFLKIGGYNTALVSGEDWDLATRIRKITAVSRITTPLIHHEHSLLHELKHKWYYSRTIHEYQKLHPDIFKAQSGIERIKIFAQHFNMLAQKPFLSILLIIIKIIEYFLFQIGKRFPVI